MGGIFQWSLFPLHNGQMGCLCSFKYSLVFLFVFLLLVKSRTRVFFVSFLTLSAKPYLNVFLCKLICSDKVAPQMLKESIKRYLKESLSFKNTCENIYQEIVIEDFLQHIWKRIRM